MKRVTRQEAVGLRLAHDVTQVIPGRTKTTYLRRGDLVGDEHLETLADMGKEHLIVLDEDEAGGADVHENEAARLLALAAAGEGLDAGEPVEGKCDLKARRDGLFLADKAVVDALNREQSGTAALITAPQGSVVSAGDRVALARIFPANVAPSAAASLGATAACLRVLAFRPMRAAVLVTGAEVASGRVPEAFGPLLRHKLAPYGSSVEAVRIVPDDRAEIASTLKALHAEGYDLLFATGGMAVDADDLTQGAIRAAGVEVRFAGVPMQPATLLLFGTLEGTPVFGVPAGVLYDPLSALDRLLPYVLAGELPTRDSVMAMGVGGMLGRGHGHRRHEGAGG